MVESSRNERTLRARSSTSSSLPVPQGSSTLPSEDRDRRRRAYTCVNDQRTSQHPPLPSVQELLQNADRVSVYRHLDRSSRADSEGHHGLGRRTADSLNDFQSRSSNQRRRLSLPQPPLTNPHSSAPRRPPLISSNSDSIANVLHPVGVVVPASRSSPTFQLESASFQSNNLSDEASSPSETVEGREALDASGSTSESGPVASGNRLVRSLDKKRVKTVSSAQGPGSEEVVEPELDKDLLLDPLMEPRTWELLIRQTPKTGRASSSGGKDKRPLDPLPIIQLKIRNSKGIFDPEDLAHSSPNLIMRASLRSSKDSSESDHFKNSPGDDQSARTMEGKNFASAHVCRDIDNSKACFFIFPDLTVKVEGEFVLCFSLIRLGKTEASLASSSSSNAGEVVKEISSDPFTVYSAKKYPGMTESSQLVKLLASQNVNIPVRNDVRRGRE